MEFAQLLTEKLLPRDTHAADAHNLLEEFDRIFFRFGVLLRQCFAQLGDPLGHLVREFHFATRVEHDLSAIFLEFTVDAEFVEVVAHLVPLHSVVTSPRGLDTRQL